MIVTFALISVFVSNIGTAKYYETKELCLKALYTTVQNNPNRIQSISCEQLKESMELTELEK